MFATHCWQSVWFPRSFSALTAYLLITIRGYIYNKNTVNTLPAKKNTQSRKHDFVVVHVSDHTKLGI